LNQLALFGRVHPPKWRDLIAELRRLNAVYDGPGPVSLDIHGLIVPGCANPAGCDGEHAYQFGREEIPGDGRPFDAPGAARRLLAALKAGEVAGS
jgi:hypothetical protein